jgi:threonine/homoserine/homoserine lactone efflux protein
MLNVLVQLPIGFVVALSGALIPGPLLSFVVAKSSFEGKAVGLKATIGHALAEFLFLGLVLIGIHTILTQPIVRGMIGTTGGLLLVGLAARSLGKLKNARSEYRQPLIIAWPSIIGGLLYSSVLNPTVPLWWFTIGFAMLMDAHAVGSTLGVACWLLGHYIADFGWFGFVSFATAKKTVGLKSSKRRKLVIFCTIFLFTVGVYLVIKYLPAVLS